MSAFAQDDNTVAVLAICLGALGGWYFGLFREQLKAKRARARKDGR